MNAVMSRIALSVAVWCAARAEAAHDRADLWIARSRSWRALSDRLRHRG
jgi:hypothetical protein